MKKPAHIIEIFLQPGEMYFGDQDTRIRTVLGSCVAITMWHPELLIGGMCHYLLPSRKGSPIPELDGRYGDEAILMFFKEAIRNDSDPCHYHIKLFGGGDMFPGRIKDNNDYIGTKNIEKARALLKQYRFSHCAEHMGGTGHRNIFFDIWSGHVWVRHQPFQLDDKTAGRGQLSGGHAADKKTAILNPDSAIKAQLQTKRPAHHQQGKALCPQ